jgi:hypothetical protein
VPAGIVSYAVGDASLYASGATVDGRTYAGPTLHAANAQAPIAAAPARCRRCDGINTLN